MGTIKDRNGMDLTEAEEGKNTEDLYNKVLRDLMDYSHPGSSIHGILQARVLEWVAIAFSDDAS